MEESPLETCSECEPEEPIYTQTQINEIETSVNWHEAILAVLLQEAGGAVEVKKEDLLSIDLVKAQASITYNEEKDTFLIEAVIVEDES